jgi:predicted transposase YdaD
MHSFEARYSALEVEQLLRRQRSHRFAVSRPATAKVQQYLDLAQSEAEFLSLLDEPYGRHRVYRVGRPPEPSLNAGRGSP